MFLAALLVHTNTSPVAVWIATYCEVQDRESLHGFYSFAAEGNPHMPSNHTLMSGWTQQLVCPYMVSGRSVAATKKTSLPERGL